MEEGKRWRTSVDERRKRADEGQMKEGEMRERPDGGENQRWREMRERSDGREMEMAEGRSERGDNWPGQMEDINREA